MAIVNSLAVGKATKTAGELTYAKVRGRIIARRRIISNKSNTAKQASQRADFGKVSRFVTLLDSWIKANVQKSAYGSARNNFVKKNWEKLVSTSTENDTTSWEPWQTFSEMVKQHMYFSIGRDASITVQTTTTGVNQTTTSVVVADVGYTSVRLDLYGIYNTDVVIKSTFKLTLQNGIWKVSQAFSFDSTMRVIIPVVFIDGVPVTTNLGAMVVNQ